MSSDKSEWKGIAYYVEERHRRENRQMLAAIILIPVGVMAALTGLLVIAHWAVK